MPESPYDDVAAATALPLIRSIEPMPDGEALLTVSQIDETGTEYHDERWIVADDGSGGLRRAGGMVDHASAVVATEDGECFAVSDRAVEGARPAAQLWSVPRDGSPARLLTRLAGGVDGIVAARAGTVVISASLMPSATAPDEDAELRRRRDADGTSAILHDSTPVRGADHELGPERPHAFALVLGEGDGLPELLDLTPRPGPEPEIGPAVLTPDGRTLIASVSVPDRPLPRWTLVAIDPRTGRRTPLLSDDGASLTVSDISHDGRTVAFQKYPDETPDSIRSSETWLMDVDGSHARRVDEHLDLWPSAPVFDRDDRGLVVTADREGATPVFRIPVGGGPIEQLTDGEWSYADARPLPDGAILALRSSPVVPPQPVRIEPGGGVVVLASPAPTPVTPATLTEVTATGEDGARIRAHLVLPPGASPRSPAPLLVFVHGGPLGSWAGWGGRTWNAPTAAARGWAVLLPDIALSTGYGDAFMARGWNAEGGLPSTDVLALTDAAVARPDIDASATAALGASFGGYLVEWIAGHTDRFRAIVAHAGLWSLPDQALTSDQARAAAGSYTPEARSANSPEHAIDAIRTPLLISHGVLDYRVPFTQAIRLWHELWLRSDDRAPTPHRLLVFPDEGHGIRRPPNIRVWWDTVFAFLDEHVRDRPPRRSAVLG